MGVVTEKAFAEKTRYSYQVLSEDHGDSTQLEIFTDKLEEKF